MNLLSRRVAAAQGRLDAIYQLELGLSAADFLLPVEHVHALLPPESPRTGVLAVESEGELHLGLYVDPQDQADPDAIIEETSHLVCLAWHAARGRSISRLQLELQGEVDRYAVARVSGRDPLRHFEAFEWADWMDPATRQRYETAHHTAHRYCRRLEARFPQRRDTPKWLTELRHYYRRPPSEKLRLPD